MNLYLILKIQYLRVQQVHMFLQRLAVLLFPQQNQYQLE